MPCLSKLSLKKWKANDDELNRLLQANFIELVKFPTWIANVFLVKKSNGKWRMCINYSDLNKACLEDYYPLPNIDQLVDAKASRKLLSVINAFSGYNQIMDTQEWEQTSFIMHRGIFIFWFIPFGLISVSAIFQQMMDIIFRSQKFKSMSMIWLLNQRWQGILSLICEKHLKTWDVIRWDITRPSVLLV